MRRFFLVLFLLLLFAAPAFAAAPLIYFSDMIDGPVSGWEGSGTRGAAVSVWGDNLGTTRGASYVTVGGVNLTNASDYAEWGATSNPTTARGLQRITFWLNSGMALGDTTITVTTSGGTSQTLPFYTRNTGVIRFVSPSGSDSNTGDTVADAWATPYHARNTLPTGGTVYFKAGTYTATDVSGIVLKFSNNHNNGAEHNGIAYVAYPAEAPVWGNNTVARGVLIQGTDETMDYHVFSKITVRTGIDGTGSAFAWGSDYPTQKVQYLRMIGMDLTTLQNAKTIVSISGHNASNHYYILGNYMHDAGRDDRGSPPGDVKGYALYLGGYGTSAYYYIAYNEMAWNVNVQGKGIQVFGHLGTAHTPSDAIDEVYIYNNYIHDNNGEGLVLGGGDDGGGGGADYGFVEDLYVYNNIIVNNGSTAIEFGGAATHTYGDGGNYYIYNNVIYNNGDALDIAATIDMGDIRNNIIIGNSFFSRGQNETKVTGANNNWYGSATDFPSWDTNQIKLDPGFTDSANDDFTLTAGSQMRDAGVTVGVVANDYIDTVRPKGAAYDIGPYEYASGSVPTFDNCGANPHLH